MSTAAATETREPTPGTTDTTNPIAKLRVWPVAVLVAAFWIFLYANHEIESSQGPRFFSRMLGFLLALVLFLVWWLSRKQVPWRDRLLAVAVPNAIGLASLPFGDKTMNVFALLLTSLPFVMTFWVAWLYIARSLKPQLQRISYCAGMLLIFGYFLLLRWDGLWAAQTAELNWRWVPTKERLFLASHEKSEGESSKDASVKSWTRQPGDCAEFRGPQRDGVLNGVTIVPDWNEHPPKPLWKKRVGPGWSAMIVVDGHLVTQEQRDKVESVVCYDAATGDELWAHDDPVRFEEALAGAGPRGTPTFANGRIYSVGGLGTLNCLRAETGELIWSHDIVKDAGVEPNELPLWGYSVSPLVTDGLVILFAGGTAGKGILAYRADDGKLAWAAASGKQSYSSPQLMTAEGQKLVLMHDTTAIRALTLADGKEIWSYPNGSEITLPMLQPHIVGPSDLVVSITPGMARLEVTRQLPTDNGQAPRWESSRLKPDFSDFVIHKGCIYGINDVVLCCLDVETGSQVWKKSRLGHGQMLLIADQDALLVSSEKGEVILVAVDRTGPKELGRFQAIEGKTWNGPVLVGNRVFLRNAAEMAAYELNVQKSTPQSPASALPTNSL